MNERSWWLVARQIWQYNTSHLSPLSLSYNIYFDAGASGAGTAAADVCFSVTAPCSSAASTGPAAAYVKGQKAFITVRAGTLEQAYGYLSCADEVVACR
jgi:hypothetical protein